MASSLLQKELRLLVACPLVHWSVHHNHASVMFDGEPRAIVKCWYLLAVVSRPDYQLMTATSCLLLAFSSAPSRELLGIFEKVVRVTTPPSQADP